MSRNQKILVGAIALGLVALLCVGAWALFTFAARNSDSIALGKKPLVVIKSPPNGTVVPVNSDVLVDVSATDDDGVLRVELWANGVIVGAEQAPALQAVKSFAPTLKWKPTSAGTYTLEARALNRNNVTSDPASLTLTAQVGAPELATSTTPVTSATTATSGPGVSSAVPAATTAPAASATNTTAPAASDTPLSPTATNTPVPPTATNTAVPPTNTPISTPTSSPTNTPVPFAVTNVSASVIPPSSNSCPTTFNFSALITTNGAGSVTYVWERSDGASAPNQNVVFSGAGTQMVNTTWSIGAAGTNWERVRIISPNALTSNQATFTLTCPGNFAGAWSHNFGTMSLAQSGSSVSGPYVNSFLGSSGTVAGTVTGNTFNGTWSISGGSGPIQWTLGSGGQTFDGNFNSGAFKWCGARTGANFPAGCAFAGAWSANVNGGAGSLNLTQNGTSVLGTYSNGSSSGTIESGAITYSGGQAVLAATWRLSASLSGPLKFYLFGYSDLQFNGNFNTSFAWCGWRSGSFQPTPCLR
jgi:Bacterial Ig domain